MVIVKVGTKEVDLTQAVRLTLGDLRNLKRLGVPMNDTLDLTDPDNIAKVLLYLCQKTDSTITEAEVDALEAPSLRIIGEALKEAQKPDRPT